LGVFEKQVDKMIDKKNRKNRKIKAKRKKRAEEKEKPENSGKISLTLRTLSGTYLKKSASAQRNNRTQSASVLCVIRTPWAPVRSKTEARRRLAMTRLGYFTHSGSERRSR
jgi:hypothetical protein